MDIKIVILLLAGAVVLFLVFWSLSQGRYGKLRTSQEVTEDFETFKIEPDVNYYVSGPDVCPNAIMGLDKSRILETDLWSKIDLTAGGMKRLVQNMRSRAIDRLLQGYDIIDDRGLKIGKWYSLPGISVTIWIKGMDRISISTPPLDIYRDRSDQ